MTISVKNEKKEKKDTYTEALEALKNDPDIRVMRQFRQHTVSNTFNHVCHVARMSHKIEKKLHVKVDEKSLLRGAVLHDYYLYDFREHPMSAYRHGTSHAGTALKNAEEKFNLNETEKNIIYSHMWPLNLTHIPRCREAWIVTLADKICAFEEMVLHINFSEG